MIRQWWRSLGFYWQVFFFMVLGFGGIISFVEGVLEPFLLEPLVAWLNISAASTEILLWVASVLFPSLALGFMMTNMVMRKLRTTAEMAKKLSYGDLQARIATTDDEKDVFNQLAHIFNDMANSLERHMYYEKRLLADISHELRSPLTRMGLATALLPMKRDSDDFDATIKLIENEIEHMSKMVGLLLEQGRERLHNKSDYRQVDLARLVGDLAKGYALTAGKEGKKLVVSLDPEILIWGHELRTRMIVDNILSNALFYTPESTQIIVTGKRLGDKAVLSVRDHGPGIPDKHRQDIFKAFFRVDASRARASGGAGLGLTLARDAAVAMGGDIEARNANPGLEMIVTLPMDLSGGGREIVTPP